MSVSAVATDILDKNPPRFKIEREGCRRLTNPIVNPPVRTP
jgi:hypothetical protein